MEMRINNPKQAIKNFNPLPLKYKKAIIAKKPTKQPPE